VIKALLFDLDDTLYPYHYFREGGFREVSLRIGERFGIRSEEIFELLLSIIKEKGIHYRYTFNEALRRLGRGVDEEFVFHLVDVFRNHPSKITLYQDLRDILPKLKRYNLGIITDGLKDVQRKKIQSLGVERLFNLIIYTEEWGYSKPSTIPYKIALDKLKVEGGDTLYIGDNPNKDFIGAKKVGIRTIRLMRGDYRDVKVSEEYEADRKIENFWELARLIGGE
jgi:putative hydrolase of the HAD superfamily